MSTTGLFENCNRYQFAGCSQLNQYLCKFLELLKKKIDAGKSVISTDQNKSERVCMLMKVFQSRKVKYAK